MSKNYKIDNDFIAFVTTHSPYLTRLIENYPYIIEEINTHGWRKVFSDIINRIKDIDVKTTSKSQLMSALRIAKSEASLLIALADISEEWDLKKTTNSLSDFADLVIKKSLETLLFQKAKDKMLKSSDINESGFIVVAAGKLGGHELNYSSDIDLIVLYDHENQNYIGSQNIKQFYINITQELVSIIQQLTGDGYVFRVDLRLRPDPYSTPVAVMIKSAEIYYENVGQNWERAAMIKARFVAGDANLGKIYMKFISKFVWRKYLDFEAIKDIHSIKRQIESNAKFSPENLLGYNIKLGKGGIREIEFFTQVQQLVWGGRESELRSRETCETLRTLEKLGRLQIGSSVELIEAYEFYRDIEHRLQMLADEATHDLPNTDEALESFAVFMGFEDRKEFSTFLREKLTLVQKFYAKLFIDSPSLGAEGNLVFTGVSNDPETLITLAKMGFEKPEIICEIMRGWHHGRRRATRLKRVREILTEITPQLLNIIANSSNPDVAFSKFDNFLNELPSGVQIFSLFNDRPQLIELFVEIMGNSPWLAENFSRSPALVAKILSSNFKDELEDINILAQILAANLEQSQDEDEYLKILRRWKHDIEFQVGIRLLKGYVSHKEASKYLSQIAEIVVEEVLDVSRENIKGQISIIAMGRLGEGQLTFGSDLDLVFVYSSLENESSQNYVKVAQKFTKIMTSISTDGILYNVDTRLRPSGNQGAMATPLKSYEKYYLESAWSWEFMALTKARAVAGDKALSNKITKIIKSFLMRERDAKKLSADMFEMRKKVAKQFSTKNPWDIKYAIGGLFEVEFIIQFFKLTRSHEYPNLLKMSQKNFWDILKKDQILSNKQVDELFEAFRFLQDVQSMVRLISQTGFDVSHASANQKRLLTQNFGEKNFDDLQKKLFDTQKTVNDNFNKIFNGEKI